MDTKEFNRLISLGLNQNTVMDIMKGLTTEPDAVREMNERKAAEKWGKNPANRLLKLAPLWDRDPVRFYLALDGAETDVFVKDLVALIEADTDEVANRLTYAATRDKDPCHSKYKSKSVRIAYRWHKHLPVTPPLLVPLK